MNYSVECAEEWSPQHASRLYSAARRLPAAIRQPAIEHFIHMEALCATWQVPSETPGCDEPVRSNIPTLLLSGEFDPGTPSDFAELVAQHLRHHYSYTFPGMGHTNGFTNRCQWQITSEFLADPLREPDASCLAGLSPAVFVVDEAK
jgi:pimeloyl-ACP methyl ester carboxylesterase